MRLSLRAVLVSLIAFAAIGGAIAALPEAKTPSPKTSVSTVSISQGACTGTTQGVSEFIDFGGNNPSKQYCALGFTGTGWQLLSAATQVEGTAQYPVGFVCRIAGWPAPAKQDCQNTPTYADGSWVYFLSNDHGGWSFSGIGSTMHKPECGTSEAWLWVAGGDDPTLALPTSKPSVFKCAD